MHDKKSDHYTSAKNYTDLDGQSRSFDFVDHDIKTKISTTLMSEEEKHKLKDQVATDRAKTILRITTLPPSLCPTPFQDFLIRQAKADDKNPTSLEWNETMLNDPGLSFEKLYTLRTLLENKAESIRYTL